MKVPLQYLHKDSLPAVEQPCSPKSLPQVSVTAFANLHRWDIGTQFTLSWLGLIVRTLSIEEERKFVLEDDSTQLS